MAKMTVKEAKEICEKSACTVACPLRDLCNLTADIGPTLSMWYSNLQFPDDKLISEVIEDNINMHKDYLEGLQQLDY